MTIKIDEDDLFMALEDNNGETTHYVDRETGEILLLMDGEPVHKNAEEIAQLLEEDPGRFLFIEPLSSRESYRIMEDFVIDLPEGVEKRFLEKALEWKKPFSNFKAALSDMPELRKQWFTYRDECVRQQAQRFLRGKGIDAELVRPNVDV